MSSRGKKKTTMGKFNREARLRDRRSEKPSCTLRVRVHEDDERTRGGEAPGAEVKSQEKLAAVRLQVQSGSLVISRMTAEERERYPLRSRLPRAGRRP